MTHRVALHKTAFFPGAVRIAWGSFYGEHFVVGLVHCRWKNVGTKNMVEYEEENSGKRALSVSCYTSAGISYVQ